MFVERDGLHQLDEVADAIGSTRHARPAARANGGCKGWEFLLFSKERHSEISTDWAYGPHCGRSHAARLRPGQNVGSRVGLPPPARAAASSERPTDAGVGEGNGRLVIGGFGIAGFVAGNTFHREVANAGLRVHGESHR